MAARANINFWSKVGIHCRKEPPVGGGGDGYGVPHGTP